MTINTINRMETTNRMDTPVEKINTTPPNERGTVKEMFNYPPQKLENKVQEMLEDPKTPEELENFKQEVNNLNNPNKMEVIGELKEDAKGWKNVIEEIKDEKKKEGNLDNTATTKTDSLLDNADSKTE